MADQLPQISEHDLVAPICDVDAHIIGEGSTHTVSAGTVGTVVLVHLRSGATVAYEVEFQLGSEKWALATIEATDIKKCQIR